MDVERGAPCNRDLLQVTWARTAIQRKATPLPKVSVRSIKGILTARQWKAPRTMAPAEFSAKGKLLHPEGCLYSAVAPPSSSSTFRNSQVHRIFVGTRLPSLPVTLSELWYRVLSSGFLIGMNKQKDDARFCRHCAMSGRTRNDKQCPDCITHVFAQCPLASSVWALALDWWHRRTSEMLNSSLSNLIRIGILGLRDPASPPPPGVGNTTCFALIQEPWVFLCCSVLRVLWTEHNRLQKSPADSLHSSPFFQSCDARPRDIG